MKGRKKKDTYRKMEERKKAKNQDNIRLKVNYTIIFTIIF